MSLTEILKDLPNHAVITYASCKPGVATEEDPDPLPEEVCVVIAFSEASFGWGEVTIIQNKDGIFLDTERLNRERIKKYLGFLLDPAITDWETDPERHELWKKAMGAECGAGCEVCFPSTFKKV